MLRKRSRAGSMPGSKPLPSPTGNSDSKPAMSSLFPSPRIFSTKAFSDPEVAMSPTSILESKYLSSIGSFLFSDKNQKKPSLETADVTSHKASDSRHHHRWADGGTKAIGLGILDALNHNEAEKNSTNLQRRMVLFGSKLKIQVPSFCSNSVGSGEVAGSPIEFGIKNKDSQLALFSPARRSLAGDMPAASSPRVFAGSIPASEMELSEDYTCVITHGPNPRTTHIFDNCIVESFDDGSFSAPRMENSSDKSNSLCCAPNGFLSSCYACKRDLGEGTDIFMYRGDRAFCSNECRYQEMLFDERLDDRDHL